MARPLFDLGIANVWQVGKLPTSPFRFLFTDGTRARFTYRRPDATPRARTRPAPSAARKAS